jgi:hypothetical protein
VRRGHRGRGAGTGDAWKEPRGDPRRAHPPAPCGDPALPRPASCFQPLGWQEKAACTQSLHCTAGLSLPVYEMGTARLACGVLERKGKGLSFREEGVVTEAGTGFEAEGLQDSGICWGLWVCPLGRDRGQDLLLSVFTWGKKSLEGCWGEERVAAPNPAPCTAKKKTDLATWVAGPPQPPLPASWGCEADVLLRATQRRSAWGKVLCSHSTGEVTEA